jgi:hypothetical protein
VSNTPVEMHSQQDAASSPHMGQFRPLTATEGEPPVSMNMYPQKLQYQNFGLILHAFPDGGE